MVEKMALRFCNKLKKKNEKKIGPYYYYYFHCKVNNLQF